MNFESQDIFSSNYISKLGFGVMRLYPDSENSSKLLLDAYRMGINYFDTGYEYMGGKSETLICETLVKRFPRESFFIADKLPVWRIKSKEDVEFIFSEQLRRLGVEYIDFYLLHAMNASYFEIVKQFDIVSILKKKQEEGLIKYMGFSFHDDEKTLEEILDYNSWDFCQLQINYYDWYAQHAKENYDLCEKRGVPVTVMEPLGGGRLIKLPEEAKSVIKENGITPAGLALNFVSGLPNVSVILTGAVSLEQLTENMENIKSDFDSFHICEMVVGKIIEKTPIQCTACGYCLKDCPRQVDIPLCFQKYNDSCLLGIPSQYHDFSDFYFSCVPIEHQAIKCIKCGKCAKRCPQKLNIPIELDKIHKKASEQMIGISIDIIKEKCKDKQVICFGAGGKGAMMKSILEKEGIHIDYYSDNNENLWEKKFEGATIISPMKLEKMRLDSVVIIASNYYEAIKTQLTGMEVDVIN